MASTIVNYMTRLSNDHKLWWIPKHHILGTLDSTTTLLMIVMQTCPQWSRMLRPTMMWLIHIWPQKMLSWSHRETSIKTRHPTFSRTKATTLRRRMKEFNWWSSKPVIQVATQDKRPTITVFLKYKMCRTLKCLKLPIKTSSTIISFLLCSQDISPKVRLHSTKCMKTCQWLMWQVLQAGSW